MPQYDLDRAVSHATGESLSTIVRYGFVPLTRGPVEREWPAAAFSRRRHDAARPSPQRGQNRKSLAGA